MHENQEDEPAEAFDPENYHLQDKQSTNRHTLDEASQAAHKRRAGVYRDDWNQKPALLSGSTKVLLSVIVIGGLGYGAFEAYDHFSRDPDAVDKLLEKGPIAMVAGDPAADLQLASSGQPPISLRGADVRQGEGIIGETVVGGAYAVEIYDAGTVSKSDSGVAIVAVMGAVGNASKEPIQAPPVQVFLLEQDGSRHAASDHRGSYSSGVALNPKLCLNHAWGFIVPSDTHFTHAVFEFPDKLKVMVNLERRTPENLRKIEASDRASFQAYMVSLSEKDTRTVSVKSHAGGAVEKQNAQQREKADALQADVDASKLRTASLLVEADVRDKSLTRIEKKLKSEIDGVKRSKQDFEKKQQLVIGAKARLAEVEAERVAGAESRTQSRLGDIHNSHVVKAEQNLARLQKHAAEAEAELKKDTKAQADLEAALKVEDQRLQALKVKLDAEQLKEVDLQKRLDEANKLLIEKERAATPNTSL